MAFTKINAAGIGTTETVTVDGLTVINDGSFGGNLTVSGVLTYEDVTNVDSVGLITARNGIVVGSGITLSKDGDIFATGITTVSGNVKVGTGITLSPDGDVFFTGVGTGNGSGLTALNASNLGSGTVPTARLGSGTASSSTFLRGDSTFAAVTSTTINNNANNRVITGSGTANTLEGEANLQFDGTNIGVGVAPSGVSSYSTIHLKGQTSGNGGAVRLTDYGDTPDSDDFTIYKNSAGGYLRINGTDPLIAYLNGADRVRINSSGQVMIGTDTPTSNQAANALTIALQNSGNTGITLRSGTGGGDTNEGSLFYSDATSGAGEYAGFLQYSHASNYFRIGVNSAEALRIDSSGKLNVGGTTGDAKLAVIDSSNPDIAMRYNGTSGGHKTRLMFMDKRGVINAQVANILHNDGVGTAAADLEFASSTGGTLTAGMILTKEGCVRKPTNPAFLARTSNANFQIAYAGTHILYNVEIYDAGGNYNTSNGRFTAPVNGYYYFQHQLSMHNGNAGILEQKVYVDGSERLRNYTDVRSGSGAVGGSAHGIIYMTAGQYAQAYAHWSSSNLNNSVAQASDTKPISFFTGFLVS